MIGLAGPKTLDEGLEQAVFLFRAVTSHVRDNLSRMRYALKDLAGLLEKIHEPRRIDDLLPDVGDALCLCIRVFKAFTGNQLQPVRLVKTSQHIETGVPGIKLQLIGRAELVARNILAL